MMEFTAKTKIYIAGCGGMLGEAVYRKFTDAGLSIRATDIDVNEPWLGYCDVRDLKQIEADIFAFKPDVIINLAALTDLEYCETNPNDAWLTNALGAENISTIAVQLNVPCVYISTAGIFDGKKDFYTDFDTPNPLSIYAKSKYYGEQYVLDHVHKSYVFRAGWMMGGGPKKDKKFINKIFMQLKEGKRVLHVVDDKMGTPTYTVDFANGIFQMLQTDQYGLYNQVCEGSATRLEVARAFINALGLMNEIKIEVVSSDFFKEKYFAPRPASEQLINLKLNTQKLNVMRHWEICMKEYSTQFLLKNS